MFIYTFDLTALIASIIGIFGVIIGVIFERKNAERIHSKQIAHYRMERSVRLLQGAGHYIVFVMRKY